MKRPNLKIIEMGGDLGQKHRKHFIKENFPNLKKDAYQGTRSTQNTE